MARLEDVIIRLEGLMAGRPDQAAAGYQSGDGANA